MTRQLLSHSVLSLTSVAILCLPLMQITASNPARAFRHRLLAWLLQEPPSYSSLPTFQPLSVPPVRSPPCARRLQANARARRGSGGLLPAPAARAAARPAGRGRCAPAAWRADSGFP